VREVNEDYIGFQEYLFNNVMLIIDIVAFLVMKQSMLMMKMKSMMMKKEEQIMISLTGSLELNKKAPFLFFLLSTKDKMNSSHLLKVKMMIKGKENKSPSTNV
jgi:hypothetical protein